MHFECRKVCKVFEGSDGQVEALRDISFSADAEEFITLVGPSGCGKTTLLRLIAGLQPPSSGTISTPGADEGGRHPNAMVFQEQALFPWMTVVDNAAFALEARGMPRRKRHQRAEEFLRKFGLGRFARNLPHELSVGMRQRVNIARAFLADPAMLLMDEPLGSLDAQTKLLLQQELLRIWQRNRKLIIYVTHDIREAVLMGDRVLVMSGHPGTILEDIAVPLQRPRNLVDAHQPPVAELVEHIWSVLETEVRRALWLTGK